MRTLRTRLGYLALRLRMPAGHLGRMAPLPERQRVRLSWRLFYLADDLGCWLLFGRVSASRRVQP